MHGHTRKKTQVNLVKQKKIILKGRIGIELMHIQAKLTTKNSLNKVGDAGEINRLKLPIPILTVVYEWILES